ncbi:MAG: permease-like cell division protein FtsX [Paenibacillaceae bacterium]
MKISTMSRHLREGTKNVVRNGWMSFASISSIAISLLLLGVFLLVVVNVDYMGKQIENQVEIRVFLELNTSQLSITALQNGIAGMSQVSKVAFVSKAEGLQSMREKMDENGKAFLEGLDGDNNPLNDAFTVEVKDPHQIGIVADQINELNQGKLPKPIERITYGKGTVEALFKATKIVRYIGIALVTCLGITAMFLISNTIKLTIMARNREIKIMKLVGATNSFIRWPFFIEGALLGFIGSIIPVVILTYGYWKLLNWLQPDGISSFLFKFKPFDEISYMLSILLLGIGIIIGIWGSTISVRKFLKV